MSSFWSSPVWLFFHTFAQKINKDFFKKKRIQCLQIIAQICSVYLPCPMCRRHATAYIRKHLTNIKTKADLILFFFNFHNSVNQRIHKPIFKFENLKIYNKYNLVKLAYLIHQRVSYFNRSPFFQKKNYLLNIAHSIEKNKRFFNTS